MGESNADVNDSDFDVSANATSILPAAPQAGRKTMRPVEESLERTIERKRMSSQLSTQSSIVSVGTINSSLVDEPLVRISVTEGFTKKIAKKPSLTSRRQSLDDMALKTVMSVQDNSVASNALMTPQLPPIQ